MVSKRPLARPVTPEEVAGPGRTYAWPRPAVTVDIAGFTVAGPVASPALEVLLIERGQGPYAGAWALPGGFVHEDEDLEAAARRELVEETGIAGVFLEQVGAVGTPGRDPRGHTVTVLFVALVPADRHPIAAAGDAANARWHPVRDLPALAFDHFRLLAAANDHLKERASALPVCFELLPERFVAARRAQPFR